MHTIKINTLTKAEADKQGSPSKSSSRPGTPNRKSITSIDSKDHEKLVNARPLVKQGTRVSLVKCSSGDTKPCPAGVTGVSTATQVTNMVTRPPVTSSTSGKTETEHDPKSQEDVVCSPSKKPTESAPSSPRPNTSNVETNTDDCSNNKKISEVQTEANAKVLLSKKTQTDISGVKDDVDLLSENLSPRNKKKPLKKQKSLSKITNSFGKIV